MPHKTFEKVDLKSLLLQGKDIEIGVFISCPYCAGQGSFPMSCAGGPYGQDQNWLQTCNRCHKEHGKSTGKMLVKVPLKDLVGYIKEM